MIFQNTLLPLNIKIRDEVSMINKIVSGGQTGVDRAGLDAAITSSVNYGGWCPQGRLDENGIIPENYTELNEISGNFKSEKENYDTRTKLNIRDSDATLIFVPSLPLPLKIKDGTLLTIEEVKRVKKPFLICDLSQSNNFNSEAILDWINSYKIKTLNIAGPRESTWPGIYNSTLLTMVEMFQQLRQISQTRLSL